MASTSKGIIEVFKNACDKLSAFVKKNKNSNKNHKDVKNQNKGIISCVFIDEIDLCEISPLNPL